MNDHFIVAIDHGHLRIFAERTGPGQSSPALDPVQSMDFPQGRASYTDRDTDMAGRFQSSKHQAPGPGNPTARTGMSIDERLPMQREESRRRAKDIAAEINTFFQQRPNADFDFAAGPDLNGTVLDLLLPEVRRRIRRSVTKDIVNHPTQEIRSHFVGA